MVLIFMRENCHFQALLGIENERRLKTNSFQQIKEGVKKRAFVAINPPACVKLVAHFPNATLVLRNQMPRH
jgi:hypothetical protein